MTNFQEQYKFVYDTLEEFITSGYTFFPVKDISQILKQKSVKEKKPNGANKPNEYEKEYTVRQQKAYVHNIEKIAPEIYIL